MDRVVAAWARERPDVDASPIQIVGRVSRLSRLIDQQLKATFNEHGLEAWEYDLLAALRRNGPEHELTAGEILRELMITSGAVTNRIDRLERRGLVQRRADDGDKRVVRVQLTPTGHELMDALLPAHLANEEAMLRPLSPSQRRQLTSLLRTLQRHLGDA